MKGKSGRKQAYGILLTSIQVRRAEVLAGYPEEACRLLQRRIGGRPIRDTEVSSIIIEEVWSDPSEEGEAWLVAPVACPETDTPKTMMWDGTALQDCKTNAAAPYPFA